MLSLIEEKVLFWDYIELYTEQRLFPSSSNKHCLRFLNMAGDCTEHQRSFSSGEGCTVSPKESAVH